MKITVITGSSRKHGNTDAMVNAFVKSARIRNMSIDVCRLVMLIKRKCGIGKLTDHCC